MTAHPVSHIAPIQKMADGTIKQVNPFSGTEVWTVPGRGKRPLQQPVSNPQPLTEKDFEFRCAFCAGRMAETPPEKARVLADATLAYGQPLGGNPEFRRVPNMFEILPYSYWQANYGFDMDTATSDWMRRYMNFPGGREHVESIVATRNKVAGMAPDCGTDLEAQAAGFFASGHDVIIARRHFVDGATDDSQLASAGTLTPHEHFQFIHLTVDGIRDLYARNPYVNYVAAFQNWLRPAGASFEHLHKQLVAIDDRGMASENEVKKVHANPNMYNEWAVDYAQQQNLVIAENEHAVLFAGFGHRFPTLEIYSKSPHTRPWEHAVSELRGMSDMVHAAHAAMGPHVPSNEEWHHQPRDVDVAMPWRIMLKLRISTLAGFEGGTHIYINTISPWELRDRVVDALYGLRAAGEIAPLCIAAECGNESNKLLYATSKRLSAPQD
ncbi:MAG: DUF4921 family protein [Corynebacterium sp.]|nr:DUF4921 family protein [Corynebacterium sp.]